MTKNVSTRIKPDYYDRLKKLGTAMEPPVTVAQILNEMVRQALPEWEKAYLIVPAVRGGKRKMVVKL